MLSKGLLPFLGSVYKEVAKTTSGTLVYRFERQTARKKFFFLPKTPSPRLRMEDFFLTTLQIAAFCILVSYFMESKLKKILIDSW